MEWIPGTGNLTLSMASTALYALAITILSALALWAERRRDGRTRWMLLITPALLGATLALLAGHFLLRYAALEVVALCVALAPLLAAPQEANSRQTGWAIYLLFRLGDVGLLAAILALYGRVGTLEIDAALAAGMELAEPRRSLIAAGFALAVWIKIGLWPFSLWLQAGRRLGYGKYAWLYLTLMPNLGLYLLYKVTPLLAIAGPVQRATLWIGAVVATISATLAAVQRQQEAGEIAMWSVQGGLILWAAAMGLKPLVWIALIWWTPLRLLSAWAFGRAGPVAAVVLAGSGLLLSAWGGLILAWSNGIADSPSRFWAQLAVALMLIWLVRTAWQAWQHPATPSRLHKRAWAIGGLGTLFLIGLGTGPLLTNLLAIAHAEMPAWIDRMAWLRALVWTPAWPLALMLVWGTHLLGRRTQWSTSALSRDMGNLKSMPGLIQAIIEKGLIENVVGLSVRAVMGLSAWLYRQLEMSGLENALRRLAQGTMSLSVWLHRRLEMSSLEGGMHQIAQAGQRASDWSLRRLEAGGLDLLLYRIADLVQAVGRSAQRLHTGRLRINLAWVVLGLFLATLALVFWA